MPCYFQIWSRKFALTSVLISLCGSLLWGQLDDNGNGLSDVWESVYGRGLALGGDPDGDGFSNREEQIAGTDPHDANSFPQPAQLSLDGEGAILQSWPTIKGVHYQPWTSSDLQNWQPVSLAIEGTGGEVAISFVPGSTFVAGGVDFRRWNNLTGGFSTFKTMVADGVVAADVQRQVNYLGFPPSDPDENQFGHWISGWIVPPETGSYTFWMSSDDQSEFWMQTDPGTEALSLLASVPQWTSYGEWDKFPEQQSAPLHLTKGESYRFEIFHREYSSGDHLTLAWTLPSMTLPLREVLSSPALSATGESLDSLRGAGGRLFFRLEALEVDSDGDGLTDYEEAILGTEADNPTTTPRINDVETARTAVHSESVLSVGVDVGRGYESPATAARFRIFRTGGIEPLTVPVSFSGVAVEGVDFIQETAELHFGPGQREATLAVTPLADGLLEPQESLTLTLAAGADYQLGTPASASVRIDDRMDEIFVANLRPDAATDSTAYGQAVLRRAGNGLAGEIRLEFSGLQSSQTASEIYHSTTGASGPSWLTLPLGELPSIDWDFVAEDGSAAPTVRAATDAGELWLRIRSTSLPDGELTGRFLAAPAWANPVVPGDPPAAPTLPNSAGEAVRFLKQASFGSDEASASALLASDYSSWIDAQMAMPTTYHHPDYIVRRDELLARNGNDGFQRPRSEVWWQHTLTASDQLRQRMAFALSQIFVISQVGGLDGSHEGVTLYYDMLLEHGFGNYRDLLEDVSLSPMMGSYLSMIRNRKPDPVTGHEPDENYAREIMQLFSIGLNRMHLDGTLMLDADGMPIPTYDQDDIVGLAHIFTGWGPHYDPLDPPEWSPGNVASTSSWFLYGRDTLRPMSFYPDYHDTQDRTIVGDTLIAGSLSGEARMQMALDTLFHHPNVAPFMARHLIQKFVTSNPSPDYIYRVASVFEDNGSGVRGDLGATLRAVLLDYEARHAELRDSISYGKGQEPIFRMTQMMRLLKPLPPLSAEGDDRFFIDLRHSLPEQGPLFSPSVFNFFEPSYSAPGPIAVAGLLAPEFQVLSETTAIRQANLHFTYLTYGVWTPEKDAQGNNYVVRCDLSTLVNILSNPARTPLEAQSDLIDYLDTYLLYGTMSPELRMAIEGFFADLPSWFDDSESRQRHRAQVAAHLVLTSPEFFVLR